MSLRAVSSMRSGAAPSCHQEAFFRQVGAALTAVAHRGPVPMGKVLLSVPDFTMGISSRDQAAVIRRRTDADGSAAGPDVGHLRQPPAVTGGGLGPAQGVHHVPCGDGWCRR